MGVKRMTRNPGVRNGSCKSGVFHHGGHRGHRENLGSGGRRIPVKAIRANLSQCSHLKSASSLDIGRDPEHVEGPGYAKEKLEG